MWRPHMDWDMEQDQNPVVIKLADINPQGTQEKGGDADVLAAVE